MKALTVIKPLNETSYVPEGTLHLYLSRGKDDKVYEVHIKLDERSEKRIQEPVYNPHLKPGDLKNEDVLRRFREPSQEMNASAFSATNPCSEISLGSLQIQTLEQYSEQARKYIAQERDRESKSPSDTLLGRIRRFREGLKAKS